MVYTVMVGTIKVYEGQRKEAARTAKGYMQSDNVRYGVSMFRSIP